MIFSSQVILCLEEDNRYLFYDLYLFLNYFDLTIGVVMLFDLRGFQEYKHIFKSFHF